jgi:hypothetical protein
VITRHRVARVGCKKQRNGEASEKRRPSALWELWQFVVVVQLKGQGILCATQGLWPGSWHADASSNKERNRAEHVEYNVAGHEIDTVMAARRSIITGAGDKREKVRRLQHERRCRNGRLERS